MLELGFIALCLTAVPMFRTAGHFGIQEAKIWLFILICCIGAAVACFTGFPALSLPGVAFFLCCAFATLSLAWCNHPRHGIREILILWGLCFFFLITGAAGQTAGTDLVLIAVFLPAPVMAAYGILQQRWKRDPLAKDIQHWLDTKAKGLRFFSFLESSNHSGCYLMLQVFIGGHLASSFHWVFAVPTALVLWGLIETRCRSACVGLIAGLVVMEPAAVTVMIPLSIAGYILMRSRRKESNAHRLLMLRVALNLWKDSPLVGHGPRVFRLRHYRTLMAMNFKDPSVHGEHSHTQGTKTHNDYAETLAEYGAVGFVILLAFLGFSLWSLWGNPFLFGAGAAFCVAMLFFYPLRDLPITLVFLSIVGSVNGPIGAPVAVPGVLAWVAIPALFVVFMQHAWKPYRANHWYAMGEVWRAVNLEPTNGVYLNAATVKSVERDPATAQVFAQRAIDYYDGELLEWMLYATYAQVAMVNGAFGLARKSFEMALLMKPSYKEAREGLKQVNSILRSFERKAANG
jgi:O-antigen ligase